MQALVSVLAVVITIARGATTGNQEFSLSDPVLTRDVTTVIDLTRFIPTGCDGSDYCEDSPDYPEVERLKEIVKKLGETDLTQLLFPKIHISDPLQTRNRAAVPVDAEDSITPKVVDTIIMESDMAVIPSFASPTTYSQPWEDYDLISETPLCHVLESYVFPKTAKSRSNQWRFVINLPSENKKENFVQAVRLEKCLNEGESCNLVTCDGSTTVCRQKYEFTRLLAISEDGKQYVDEFRFPSGCVCYSKKNSGFTIALSQSDQTEVLFADGKDSKGSVSLNKKNKKKKTHNFRKDPK